MTTSGRSTVVGVFHDRSAAERAVEDLERAGFSQDQIGLVRRHEDGDDTDDTKSGETAGGGALTGAAVGGLIGAAAVGLIPGIGPFLAAGALASILTGAAVGAATGGLAGALIGAGIPEDEAGYYEGEVRSGRTIVTVRANGRYAEAAEIMRRHGAYDVNSGGKATTGTTTGMTTGGSTMRWEEHMPTYRTRWQKMHGSSGGRWEDYEPAYRYGWEMRSDDRFRGRGWNDVEMDFQRDWETRHPDKPWDRFANWVRNAWEDGTDRDDDRLVRTDVRAKDTDENRRIQLKEEELRAVKHDREAGEVRVRKEVVTEQKTIDVPVRHEEVVIERHPVEGRMASTPIREGEEIRVPVREEVVDVEKRAVVREELNIGKRDVVENERVADTVRREEVRIEREGDVEVDRDVDRRTHGTM